MILHTSNGFEFDSEKPKRLSFVLGYAGDNPKYNTANLEYKPKSLIKSKAIFRYVEGINHGSATFLYSSNVFLDKSNSERYLESDTNMELALNNSTRLLRNPRPSLELEKASSSISLSYLPKYMWKVKALLLTSELKILYKTLGKSLRASVLSQIWIKKPKLFHRFIPQILINRGKLIKRDILHIWIKSNISLDSFIPNIYKESNKFLSRYILQVYIQSSQCLEYVKLREIWIEHSQIFSREYQDGLSKLDSVELIINTPRLMLKVSNLSLQDMELRGLSTPPNFLDLHRENLKYVDKAKYFMSLHRGNLKYMGQINIKFGMKRVNLKSCDSKTQDKYLTFSQAYNMYKDKTKLLGYNSSRLIDIFKLRLLSKSDSLTMIKHFEIKGLKRVNLFRMLKDQASKLLNYTPLVHITHTNGRKFVSRVNEFRITKPKNTNSLKRVNVLTFGKMKLAKFLDRLNLTRLYKLKSLSVSKNILFPIYKKFSKALNKNEFNIYCDSQKSISKTNPFPIDLNTKISSLKVIKRWWIVSEGSDYDSKIQPSDYDYENYPLVGSYGLGYERTLPKDVDSTIESMKLKYFNNTGLATPYDYIPQVYDLHPNILNPYMEHDDRSVGLYEIPLAINIMMEMVNLLGLIVHHQASQLCYCTGQEAMWLIMEMLDDWLNMESTVEELNRLGVMEQYHRTYRWVRWEAEKVYFDDRASSRFTGLKAGGQLLANLIEYMKLHHFNIVPMWKDLSRMDYWRNQSNRDNTPVDDISLQLSKIKGKRHLNIEAQKLDRTLNESIPTEK